jgi:hypothetical protein
VTLLRPIAAGLAVFAAAAVPLGASAEWRPPDVHPATASLADVLRAYRTAAGTPDPRFEQRRERWTYAVGERRLPVRVAVRGEDFRATVDLGSGAYAGGRWNAIRWRADANGIAHATLSDDQGDAADRLPQSVFPFSIAECALAGESTRYGRAWVVIDRAARDRPHWFYVDEASGRIVREETREGARTVVTTFERFDRLGTMTRPRRWRVEDGDASHTLEVTVDDVEPASLTDRDVAIPEARRTFAAPAGAVTLPTHFGGRTIYVDVDLDGERREFILDTGTASITLDAGIARWRRWTPFLEHAIVPRMAVGDLTLADVSTLAIPLSGLGYGTLSGILGYDFFAGHVVHVDYAARRVEVLTGDAAESAFHDPHNAVVAASFDEGMPIVRAAFGPLAGDRFALDTGSPHLFALAPFTERYASAIAKTWTPTAFARGRNESVETYLEGSIVVAAHRVSAFTLGPATFRDLVVGTQVQNALPDAIDMALDGIVGTDEMALFDWWFDYDGDRIAMRRNGLR